MSNAARSDPICPTQKSTLCSTSNAAGHPTFLPPFPIEILAHAHTDPTDWVEPMCLNFDGHNEQVRRDTLSRLAIIHQSTWRVCTGYFRAQGVMSDLLPIVGEFSHGFDTEDERMRIHVALAQVQPNEAAHGNVYDVLPRMKQLLCSASELGADVVVFPEYFLTGSSHEAWRQSHTHDPLDSFSDVPVWLEDIRCMAREFGTAIVTGSAVLRHANERASPLYNTTYFLDARGDIKGAYTKRNLWHAERAVLTPATDVSHPKDEYPPVFMFETRRGLRVRVSMLMCWDLMFPESFRRLFVPPGCDQQLSELDRPNEWTGPDIVFTPTCWYADDSGTEAQVWNKDCEAACLDAICVARAMENECFVCMCNAAGSSNTSPRGLGRTSVNAPLLGCSARVSHAHEAWLLQTLQMPVLSTARRTFKIRQDIGYYVMTREVSE